MNKTIINRPQFPNLQVDHDYTGSPPEVGDGTAKLGVRASCGPRAMGASLCFLCGDTFSKAHSALPQHVFLTGTAKP